MTETTAEQAGQHRNRRFRGLSTAFAVALMSVLALDVSGLNGQWQGSYNVILAVTMVAFAVIGVSYRSMTAGGRKGDLASEPIRRWFKTRGAALASVSAVLIGITGSPDFASWWQDRTGFWGPWIVLAVSAAIAALSTWDMTSGESTQVQALRSRAEVSRRQAKGLLGAYRALKRQSLIDRSVIADCKAQIELLRGRNADLEEQLRGPRRAPAEQGITLS